MAKQTIEKQPNEQGLLPCACGCDDVVLIKTEDGYSALCGWCGHQSKDQPDEETARHIWNVRQKSRKTHSAQWLVYKTRFECSYCHSLHEQTYDTCPVCHSVMKLPKTKQTA